MTPDPAYATRRDVERAVRIRLLKFGLGQYVQDVTGAVMGVVGEVIDCQAREIARLREAQGPAA